MNKLPYGILATYYSNPKLQNKQLIETGFKLLKIYGEGSRIQRESKFAKFLSPWIYYIALKEER